ncbi:MAG: response regulator transcription factor [Lachnospiraceae bacterium]|nr:response regulator transcription factor [Lachnospiraceae bacterium]
MALIYVVEDDESIREIETIALKNSGHEVCAFENAGSFYKKMEELLPDLLVLDVMLPDSDGNTIVKKLRTKQQTAKLPIIMVTAKTTEIDMVKGLDNGADDYIKKPFSIMELISRVKALLRRCEGEKEETLMLGSIVIDNVRHKCEVDGEIVELTYKEHELLKYLLVNKGIVLSRDRIMLSVWGTEFEGESRTVDMHIKTLRQKLKTEGEHIKTVRNVGYVAE